MSERSFSFLSWHRQAPPAASRWSLALAIAGSALAVGAVHTLTLCIVVAVLLLSAVFAWWGTEPIKVRPVATVLLLTGASLTAYTALQCVPMPIAWLAAIAPHNADVWSRVLAPLHETGPSWAPISLDPTATRVEVLKGVAYLLAFVTALRLARRREGVAFLSGAVVVTGLVLAVAALLHPAFGAHSLFGVYEPGPGIAGRHVAPLMNPNNLAGYLNLAVCLALAATLAPEPRAPRAITGAVVLVLGATQVWVASRGGVLTMCLGVLLVGAILYLARVRERRAVATLSVIAGLGASAGAVLIALSASQDVSQELFEGNVSKLRMFWHTMRMLPAVPVFGCGRGAFESSFPPFRTDVGLTTLAVPENVVAQWILEWGVPLGVAGLVAVVFALRPNAVLARSTTAAGAWAGLVALAVQNLGDLGTEVPGLMVSAVVCAAIVVAGTPGREPTWRVEHWAAHSRVLVGLAVGTPLVAIALAVAGMGRELHDDQLALREAAFDRRLSAAEMRGEARGAMLRHPGEPYLPFIVGLRASYRRDDNAIPWLGAALERSAIYAPAHLILARIVAIRSPSQARLEYRLAMEQAPDTIVGTVMAEAPSVVHGTYDAFELVPPGESGVPALELLVEAIKDRLPATRVQLDRDLARRAPAKPGPVVRAASDAVDDLAAGEAAPWCEGPVKNECVRLALEETASAERLAPDACMPRVLRARARMAAGEVEPALDELARATDGVTERVACLQALEGLAGGVGDARRAQAALDKVASAGCATDEECARNLTWVASQEEAHGNQRKALAIYKRAYERAPEDDALLQGIAGLAAQVGLHAEAAEDYERLARRHPNESQWKEAAAREREVMLKGVVKL